MPETLSVVPVRKPVRVRPVPAVTRSIAILRLLGRQKQGAGVKAVADELGLVPSTCLHILRVLVAENLVRQDAATKRYTLGSGMVSLARSVLEGSGFAGLAQPGLERLVAMHGITAMGAEVTSRGTILVLAAARPDRPLQLHADVGSEFPSLTSATGRLVAAYGALPANSLSLAFGTIQWDRPPTLDEWLADVADARLRGWAVDRDRFKNGITAFAVPVLSAAGPISHSLVAMGLSADVAAIDPEALVRDMQREASAIAAELHEI